MPSTRPAPAADIVYRTLMSMREPVAVFVQDMTEKAVAEEVIDEGRVNEALQKSIQGWKKAKIYPDFIFAVRADGTANRITVLETKGDQLDNLDTAYKRRVLSFLSGSFAWDGCTQAGQLELIANGGQTVQCALVLMSEWKTKLPRLVAGHAN